jgi:tape measure domain-containing protein
VAKEAAKAAARKKKAAAVEARHREKMTLAYVKEANKRRLAIARLDLANKRLAKSSRKAGRGMGIMNAAGNRIRYGLIGMLGGALGAAGIGMIGKGIFDSLAKTSDSLQKIGPMFQDSQAALKAFRVESERTGVSAHELAEGFVNLRRRGFDQNMSADIVALGEDIGSTQSDPRATTRVINAIGQIKGKGKLSTEELNQLAEGGGLARGELLNNILKARGRGTGKQDISFINKQLETGQITADEGIDALFKTYLDMYNIGRKEKGLKLFDRPGQMAEEIGRTTVRGNVRRMKTTFENLTDSLALLAGPGITRGLAGMTKTFKSISGDKSKMDALGRVVESMAEEFSDFGTKVMPMLIEGSGNFLEGFLGVSGSLRSSESFMEKIVRYVDETGISGKQMGKNFREIAGGLGEAVESIVKLGAEITRIAGSPSFKLLGKTLGLVDGALGLFTETDKEKELRTGVDLDGDGYLGNTKLVPESQEFSAIAQSRGMGKLGIAGSTNSGAPKLIEDSAMLQRQMDRETAATKAKVSIDKVEINSAPDMTVEEFTRSLSNGFGDAMSDANWGTSGQP